MRKLLVFYSYSTQGGDLFHGEHIKKKGRAKRVIKIDWYKKKEQTRKQEINENNFWVSEIVIEQ